MSNAKRLIRTETRSLEPAEPHLVGRKRGYRARGRAIAFLDPGFCDEKIVRLLNDRNLIKTSRRVAEAAHSSRVYPRKKARGWKR